MRATINYEDLRKRPGFKELEHFALTDTTKIKYPDRTATHKLEDRLNNLRRKKLKQKESHNLKSH